MNENKIVVGFDGSTMSTAALQWAAEHSRLSGAPLLAVHTWEQPSAEEYSGGVELRHLTGRDARKDADSWVAAALGERTPKDCPSRWTSSRGRLVRCSSSGPRTRPCSWSVRVSTPVCVGWSVAR